MQESDADILKWLEAGNSRGMTALFDRYYRPLVLFADQLLHDIAWAEDVVQETLIRVWNKRDEWQELSSVEAYCLTVARNLAIDRSERKDAQTVELTADAEQAPDAANPYERLVDEERVRLVHRLINELPETQRLVIHLRDIEGKSYKEIATLLSLTEEQVKVYLFRARQKVKQRFTDIDNYGL